MDNNKLISFTGAQSTGKTTLLNHLMKRNREVEFVPEVTRRISKDYNLNINEDGGFLTQSLIIADHIKNVYRTGCGIRVLDRCAVDGFIYTNWLQQNTNDVPFWCTEYAFNVMVELLPKYDIIFYTDPQDVELIDDGERSVDVKFRDEIIENFEAFMKMYSDIYNFVRLSGTVEERLATIKREVPELKVD